MWLKCGAKPSAMPRAATRKEWLKYWNCGECCSAQYLALVLTMNGAGPYNHLHSARRPLTARLRASEAPHLCVDRTSEKKRRFKFRRLLGSPREVGNRKVSGLFDK